MGTVASTRDFSFVLTKEQWHEWHHEREHLLHLPPGHRLRQMGAEHAGYLDDCFSPLEISSRVEFVDAHVFEP